MAGTAWGPSRYIYKIEEQKWIQLYMAKVKGLLYGVCFLSSIALNIFFLFVSNNKQLSWSQRAALDAERVASVSCSGHGRAYLDGLLVQGKPAVCECNTCYQGPDCSHLLPDCAANANSGDPLFLEPFWMQHAESSALLVSGWHRMSYVFPDQSSISQELLNHILKVHSIARNANTKEKYLIFGGGSTQLLSAAVFALSLNSSSPARVVAASPYYPMYKTQTNFFETAHFEFQGDALLMNNTSDSSGKMIEFVTSPNNPDGHLRKAVVQGNSSAIYDHAYYWPHFTAIPSPADEDIMIFTISKLTGHAGSRFGWAIVKNKDVYLNMQNYIQLSEMGISRDTQLRALQLLKAILAGNGKEIFHFAYQKMRDRWEKISRIVSLSKRFTLQDIPPMFCNFFEQVRGPSPAYAWLKCEREEETNCTEVLREGNIIGRLGSLFVADDHYVRLSLLKSDDDFNLLLHRLRNLVTEEDGVETM